MNSFLFKIFSSFFEDIFKFIEIKFGEKLLTKVQKKKILLLFLKGQRIIIFFVFCHLLLVKFIFFFINLIKFIKKNFDAKYNLINFLFNKNIIKFKKIVELVNALSQLTNLSQEKIFVDKKNSTGIEKVDFFENIVVGSGPSGSVTAANLIDNKFETLMIEKGFQNSIPKTKHPASEFYYKWKFSGLSGAIGKYDLQYASAECFGGGSEINSGLFHEIDDDFIKTIQSKNQILDFVKINNEWDHLISKNNLLINTEAEQNLNNYFLQGSSKLGFKTEQLSKFFDKENNKNSMSRTILKKALSKGLKIITGYELKSFFKSKNLWNLILVNKSNFKKKIKCKNLFLCCGAPYTLNLLKENNILKKKHNQNFHFHPMIKIIAKFPKQVNNNINENVISTQVTQFYPKYLFGNAASDIQFLKIFGFGNKEILNDIEENSQYMSIFHSTYSLGSCKFTKIPFFYDPIILFNINTIEKNIIKDGINNLLKFVFSSGAEYVYLSDQKKITFYDENKINETISDMNFSFSSVHLLGGIRFGESNDCFFNSFGKIKNSKFENLYVNDSSLVTENLLKNPQGTIMSIAQRNIKNFIRKNI